jgi:hypothetical protein
MSTYSNLLTDTPYQLVVLAQLHLDDQHGIVLQHAQVSLGKTFDHPAALFSLIRS